MPDGGKRALYKDFRYLGHIIKEPGLSYWVNKVIYWVNEVIMFAKKVIINVLSLAQMQLLLDMLLPKNLYPDLMVS